MVAEWDFVAPLLAALRDLATWWQTENVPGVLIGGVAASLLGRPRITRDVAGVVIVPENDWPAPLSSASRFHFIPRKANVLAFARDARVLLLTHSTSQIQVDISLGLHPFEEEAVERKVMTEVAGLQLPLPRPEDLIIMKAVAGRPRDIADIEGILAAQPKLDRPRIRHWVEIFANITERPEMIGQLESLLSQRRSASKKKRKQ